MSTHEHDESLELLEQVERRARSRLAADLSVFSGEFSGTGALGRAVRSHPLLSLAGASAAGVGLALIARGALRASGRLIHALSLWTTLGHTTRGHRRPLGLLALGHVAVRFARRGMS